MALKIVDKWIDSDSDAWMTLQTPDGVDFSFSPTWDFYNEHDVGTFLEAEVHEGALGYPWFAWERPAVSWLQEKGNAVFIGIVAVTVIALVYYKSKVKARKQAHRIAQYVCHGLPPEIGTHPLPISQGAFPDSSAHYDAGIVA